MSMSNAVHSRLFFLSWGKIEVFLGKPTEHTKRSELKFFFRSGYRKISAHKFLAVMGQSPVTAKL